MFRVVLRVEYFGYCCTGFSDEIVSHVFWPPLLLGRLRGIVSILVKKRGKLQIFRHHQKEFKR